MMSVMSDRLTDFLRPDVLQEIQDGYAALTGLQAMITDAQGQPLTRPSDQDRMAEREQALSDTLKGDLAGPLKGPFGVPIVADGKRLGAIVLTGKPMDWAGGDSQADLPEMARRFGIEQSRTGEFTAALAELGSARQTEAVRFLYLLADAIAQICVHDMTLQQRVDEMTVLYRLSTMLAGRRDLQEVLDTVCEQAAAVMDAKAASIRLLDAETQELVPMAVYNLSRDYLDKGPVRLTDSPIDRVALADLVGYVQDMSHDSRVLYPDDARREGIASILVAGMVYRGKSIGVMRIYTEQPRQFTDDEKQLLQAIAQQSAAAIENARLDEARKQTERVQRQIQLAADVQRRMMPLSRTYMAPFDMAGRYEPCFELGGDFFDLIPLQRTVGLVLGDVVGKGVAASLLMASVRASLRAYVEDVYDLDEIMAKVNAALTRETRDNEFATVFYGTLDTDTLRLTYCSAGHDPSWLLRDGQFVRLDIGGMALGIDADQQYDKGLIDMQPGDVLLVHSDGVPDAMNFAGEKFGRERVHRAMLDAADRDAQGIVNHILWEVRRFVGLNEPSDDITMLVVKVDPDHQVRFAPSI